MQKVFVINLLFCVSALYGCSGKSLNDADKYEFYIHNNEGIISCESNITYSTGPIDDLDSYKYDSVMHKDYDDSDSIQRSIITYTSFDIENIKSMHN